jgi:hypothetical protein
MQLNYQASKKAAEERATQQQFAEDTKRGLDEVYAAFPQLLRNQATDGILQRYCGTEPVSLAVIQYGFGSADSGLLEQVQFVSDAEARNAFIDKIVALSGASPASQAFQRKQLESRVRGSNQNIYSTPELAAQAAAKEQQVALRSMSPDAVVALTKTSTDPRLVGASVAADNARRQAHRQMPDGRLYPPVPLEIGRAAIAKASPAQQRAWNRQYHPNQMQEAFQNRK